MPVYISTACLANGGNLFKILATYNEAGFRNVELGASHQYTKDLSLAKFQQYGLIELVI